MAKTDNASVPAPGPPSLPALPLVPFEEYMLLDDRPAYPMNFFLRLRFAGCLVPERFDDACRQAVARHPLLAARITRRKRRWYLVHRCPPVAVLARTGYAVGQQHLRASVEEGDLTEVQLWRVPRTLGNRLKRPSTGSPARRVARMAALRRAFPPTNVRCVGLDGAVTAGVCCSAGSVSKYSTGVG